jgi:hypothetical protein
MSMPASSFLRRILLLDALASGGTGLLMALFAQPLQDWLGVPAALLRYAGWCLVPFAGLLLLLARSQRLAPGAVVAVIVLNGLWVVGSVVVLLAGVVVQPSALGHAFVLGQAVAVAVLAEMETIALRSSA